MSAGYLILRKAGDLRSGAESRKGRVWHAISTVPSIAYKAMCGTEPAIKWCSDEGDTVTCPRCLKKLPPTP